MQGIYAKISRKALYLVAESRKSGRTREKVVAAGI